jgi:hypothetical protein
MSVIQGGFQGITIYKPTATIASIATKGIRNVSVDIQPEYADLASGKRRPIGFVRSVSFDCVDFSVRDQLKTWADDLTDVHFVLVGRSRCFQGYDNCFVNLTDIYGPYGDLESFRIELVNTKFAPTWYTNTNLAWFAGWLDGDTDEIPDSGEASPTYEYVFDESNVDWTLDFSEPTLTFYIKDVTNASNVATLYRDIVFPFPGLTATISVEVTETTGITSSNLAIGCQFRSSADTLISTSTTNAGGSVGRKTHTATIPDGTYTIRLFATQLNNLLDPPDFFFGNVDDDGGTEVALGPPSHSSDVWDDVKAYNTDLSIVVPCSAGKAGVLYSLIPQRLAVKYPTLRVDGVSAETLY